MSHMIQFRRAVIFVYQYHLTIDRDNRSIGCIVTKLHNRSARACTCRDTFQKYGFRAEGGRHDDGRRSSATTRRSGLSRGSSFLSPNLRLGGPDTRHGPRSCAFG